MLTIDSIRGVWELLKNSNASLKGEKTIAI